MSYTYGDQNHKHAVTALSNGNTYTYDANGNMTYRHVYEGGNWKNYTLAYDAENHLTAVSGDATASFGYDGDGKRIVATEGGVTTAYIGNYFEWNDSAGTLKKYYYAGATRIAMRSGSNDPQFLLSDHLGSTTKILNYDGSSGASGRGYKPWGEVRFGPDDYPTAYQYTGQHRDKLIGLYYYGARWYDTALGRFVQADGIIPGVYDTQSYDRYAYVRNNPINLVDPTGNLFEENRFDFKDGLKNKPPEQNPPTTNFDEIYYGEWARQQLIGKFGITVESGFNWIDYLIVLEFALDAVSALGLVAFMKWLSGVSIIHGNCFGNPCAPSANIIRLPDNWKDWFDNNPLLVLAHEFGHIIDNRSTRDGNAVWFGGGLADDLIRGLGGESSFLRWANGSSVQTLPSEYFYKSTYLSAILGTSPSTSDYLAHSYALFMYGRDILKPGVAEFFCAAFHSCLDPRIQ